MFEYVIESIGEILTSIFIRIPGAFIRWIVIGKMDLDEYFEDDWETNCITVIMVLIPSFIIISLFGGTYYL